MSNDSFTINPELDIMAQSGVMFVTILKKYSLEDNANPALVSNWKIIENWLDCANRELNESDKEKIQKGWITYLATETAPNKELEDSFAYFSNKYKEHEQLYLPNDVIQVFSSLINNKNKPKNNQTIESDQSWWQKKSKAFRQQSFISIAWFIIYSLYTIVFEPYGYRLNDEDWLQFYFIALTPASVFILYHLYKKFTD